MPILKGRAGELLALDHLSETQAGRILPILEVVPLGLGPIKDAYKFGKEARERLPAGPVGIDVRYLANPETGWRRPITDIIDDLGSFDICALPVVHLTDPPERLRDHGEAAQPNGGRAIVRLGDHRGRPDDGLADDLLLRLNHHVGVAIEQCDLVLDMSSVASENQVVTAEPVVRKCVSWARRRPWHSITVVAGAMPTAEHLRRSAAMPAKVRRWDQALHDRLVDLDVEFGDYGIASPQLRPGWRPPPNLRYTSDADWWIYRSPASPGAGNRGFFDLCSALVESDHWAGPDHCWGDAELDRRARRASGPGIAKDWRAWGTSHHLAHVLAERTG